jgi:hypothetical protein
MVKQQTLELSKLDGIKLGLTNNKVSDLHYLISLIEYTIINPLMNDSEKIKRIELIYEVMYDEKLLLKGD